MITEEEQGCSAPSVPGKLSSIPLRSGSKSKVKLPPTLGGYSFWIHPDCIYNDIFPSVQSYSLNLPNSLGIILFIHVWFWQQLLL